MKRIAFVCLGNICRSPFAAALARERISTAEIYSSGFYHREGRTTPEKIQRIAAHFHVDLSAHRSTRLTGELLDQCDLVLVMDRENMAQMEREFPEAARKSTFLGLFATPARLTVPDPYTADATTTQQICEQMVSAVEGLTDRLMKSRLPAVSGREISSLKAGVQ